MTTFKLTLSAALVASLMVTPDAHADESFSTPTAFARMLTSIGVDAEEADHYWRLYGFISDGSMMRPDAFRNYGAPTATEVRTEIDLTTIEPPVRMTPEPVDEPESENSAIFVEPSLLAACGMSQPTAYFAFDSAELSMATDPMINVLVDCMHEYPLDDARLTVTGHADPRGPEEYNRELGLERANALARQMVEYGLSEDRIDTYSWGEAKASDDPDRWVTDRRVVIRLDK